MSDSLVAEGLTVRRARNILSQIPTYSVRFGKRGLGFHSPVVLASIRHWMERRKKGSVCKATKKLTNGIKYLSTGLGSRAEFLSTTS
jgi:hypothetical protein